MSNTVLLIDDDPEYARTIGDMLAETKLAPFELVCAAGVSAALHQIDRGVVDVVLMKLSLPESEDIETVHLVDLHAPETPVVVLSDMYEDDLAMRAIQGGVQDFLVKGQFDARMLAKTLLYAIERKRTERAATQLAAIVEFSDDAILGITLDGRITSWNHGARRMYGYTAEEAIGRHVSFLIPADRIGEVKRILKKSAVGTVVHHHETRRTCKDGMVLDVALTISPVRNSSGAITGISEIARDITARLQAESAIRESEERFRTMANTAPVMIWTAGPDGAIDFVNTTWQVFVGWPHDGDFTTGWLQSIHPSDSQRCLSAYLSGVNTRGGFTIEYRMKRADGQYRWVVDTVVPRVDTEGGFAGLIGSCVDITSRKEFEEVIRRAEEDWVNTVDAVSDLIVLEDTEGCVRRCNRAMSVFFGLRYHDLIGKPLADLFVPKSDGVGMDRDRRFSEAFRRDKAEVRFEGHKGWHEVSTYRIGLGTSMHGGWVHVVKDISARKENEAALRRLNAAIEQAAESIAVVDGRGRFQYVNPAFEKTAGVSRAQALGRRFKSLDVGPSEREDVRRMVTTLARGEVWSGSFSNRHKDGSVSYGEATISPVKDPSGAVVDFVAVGRDVSERKRLEAIAEAVNTMETAGYIFSGIRHELGNPINSVKTALSVLRANLRNYSLDVVENYLDRTLEEILRVEFLLRALKTFSMHENPKIERVAMGPLLARFCALAEEDFARRGIYIDLACDAPKAECMVDPRAFHQVLLNIFANAADALAGHDNARIDVRLSAVARRVEVRISDNGVGMTEQQQDDLFKPFYTSKRHGTGLGLVIIKKLVTKMNGTVKVTSRLGAGTSVILLLESAV